MARVMLLAANLQPRFWREAVGTTIYTLNRTQLRPNCEKTPYELWNRRPALVKYFKIFGSKCFIKINDVSPGKFDSLVDEGIFLGYSTWSKAYKCYNYRLKKIVESIDVKVDEELPVKEIEEREDDFLIEEEEPKEEIDDEEEEEKREPPHTPSKMKYVERYYPEEQIIGNRDEGVQTRKRITTSPKRKVIDLLSMIEPKTFAEERKDRHWVKSMEEEMSQIKKNKTWEQVSHPKDKNIIGTKWVFKNEMNEEG